MANSKKQTGEARLLRLYGKERLDKAVQSFVKEGKHCTTRKADKWR